MISVQEALRLVLEDLPGTGMEQRPVPSAGGRVLTAPIRSTRTVPPFRNTAMDGYAVRAADCESATADRPVRLRVLEVVGAGAVPQATVTAGTTTQVMTGTPLPEGADSVVRVEDVTAAPSGEVLIAQPVRSGANVRHPGEDVRAGDVVLTAGQTLRPADIGLLASLGVAVVPVAKRPEVAILATGSELVELGQPLGPGQIANSNAYTLAAAVAEAGGTPRILGIVADTPEATREAFADALASDVVLSTGGVSVGAFDFVRAALTDLGVAERFWKVAQRPGKPLSFGRRGRTPVFGLPGNPASSLVCFYLYVRPALRVMLGDRTPHLPAVQAVLDTAVESAAGLTEFLSCTLSSEPDGPHVRPAGSRSSGVLRSMSIGDALLVAAPTVTRLAAGAAVRVIRLSAETATTPPF
ncbi:molybdopterin molybdotransferase MoeA [Candidatus Binatia bacterium]|nr:molybdopterin molybdotransferase MoeA [Candidatus Binatia bacterium]